MPFFRTLCALLVLSSLAACSTVDDLLESRKIDYKSASKQKLPELDIPPDLTLPSRDDRFAVPDSQGKGSATLSAYEADRAATPVKAVQGTEVLPSVDKMRIERSGTQRWLVVPGAPDKVWPAVKEFWQDVGFLVNVELPDAGVMETDWAENRANLKGDMLRNLVGKILDQVYSTPERDKFRTRLEPGAESGTTEIYISHRGVMEVYVRERSDETVWQPRPSDPELEAEMLRRLMVRLGADEARAKTMVAASAPQTDRAQMRAIDKSGSLDVLEPFDRAWRRVGLALDRIGFTVEDRDRSQGLYFVRYVDPEADAQGGKKEKGFLSKLLFFMPDDKPEQGEGAQGQYRIHVKGDGSQTRVEVLTREGGQDTSSTAKRILSMLHNQLK